SFAEPIIDLITGTDRDFGICITDLDGDGKADIAVTSTSYITIFRNTGSPGVISFAGGVALSTRGGTYGLLAGDIDGDGKTDLAAAISASSSAYTMSVFRNISTPGNLLFASRADYTTPGGATTFAMGDLNGDGKPDIVTANGGAKSVSVFQNNSQPGTISLATRVDYILDDNVVDAVIGDFDADGKPEITALCNSKVSILKNKMNNLPAPEISSFTPTSATTGATITITGARFTGATSVLFGNTAAASFTVVSDTEIKAVVAAGASGDVQVLTPQGTASKAGFTYILPVPEITTFLPNNGGTGTEITIKGNHFTGATNVIFGSTAAASFTVVSDTEIKAIVGAGASGNVQVITPQGTASVAGFTFIVPAPVITTFLPTSGGTNTEITIRGSHFTGTSAVSFGGTSATSFIVVSDSVITAIVGTGASGSITIVTANGTTNINGFTFVPNTGRTMVATPNPATGFVMVNHPASTGFAQIKLIDMQGNIISNIRVNPAITTTRVELAGVKQGIYTVYWTDGSDNLTQLILVQ
ncbi:MAG TPA: IPT/TIG domain-containing protein, partial [Niastella sp.]